MTAQPTSGKASLVLHNGVIHTLSADLPIVEAIAFGNDGRILALGTHADLKDLIGAGTRIADLNGRFAMPGIIDFHVHALSSMIVKLYSVCIDATVGFDEVLDRIRVGALKQGTREWVVASAFGPTALGEIEALGAEAKRRLDAVSNGRPVFLEHVSGHGGFANSLALQRAGIDAKTKSPPDGEIVKAPSGEPTGMLQETAAWLVQRAIPPLGKRDLVKVARSAVEMFNRLGITGFCDASATAEMLDIFRTLDDDGQLSCWAGFTLALSSTCPGYDSEQAASLLSERRNLCGPHMIAESAKIFLDGVPSLRTAAMLEPYVPVAPNQPLDYGGQMNLTMQQLANEIAALDRMGLSVKVHAVGDRAVRTVLDAVEHVRQVNSPNGPQHHIAHGQFIRDEDIPRLSALNVLADLSPPLWFPSSASNTHQRIVGPTRYAKTWRVRTILDSGADVAVGSDWLTIFPDIDPWQALAGLVTRKDPSGIFSGIHGQEEAISLDAALPLFTRNPAQAMALGDRTGRLAPALSADLIVLDRNLFEVAPEEIAGTRVLATFFEGQLVHGAV